MKLTDTIYQQMMERAREDYPSALEYRIDGDRQGYYVEACFSNETGEFLASAHDEYIPSTVWIITGIEDSQFS